MSKLSKFSDLRVEALGTSTYTDQQVTSFTSNSVATPMWQSFQPAVKCKLISISVRNGFGGGTPSTTNVQMSLYEGEGTGGTQLVAPFNTPTMAQNTFTDIPFVDGPILEADTTYSYSMSFAFPGDRFSWSFDNTNPYSRGRASSGAGNDASFKLNVVPLNELTFDKDNGIMEWTGTAKAKDLDMNGAYTLPDVDGTNGQTLKTNGAGTVTWQADDSGLWQQEDEPVDLPGTVDQSNFTVFNPSNGRTGPWQSFQPGLTSFLTQVEITNVTPGSVTLDFKLYSGVGTGGTLLVTESGVTFGNSADIISLTTPILLTQDADYTWELSNISGAGSVDLFQNTSVYTRGSSDLGGNDDYIFRTYETIANVLSPVTNPDRTIISGDVLVYEDEGGTEYMRTTYDDTANSIRYTFNANPGGSGGSVYFSTLADTYPNANLELQWGTGTRIKIEETFTLVEDTLLYGYSLGEQQIPEGGTINNHDSRVKYYTVKSNTPATTTNIGNLTTPRDDGEQVIIVGSDDTRQVRFTTTGNIKTANGRPLILGDRDSIGFVAYNNTWYETNRTVLSTGGYDPSFINVDTTNVSNPPTDAELDAAFGTPAAVGAGFTTFVNDNGGNTNVYLVMSDGTNWHYTLMATAV